MEEIELFVEDATDSMEKALSFTESELSKIRAGKASPSMLIGLSVEYYGTMTPIEQVSSINTLDARTLIIKPWEKNILKDIETAIINSDLGLNPQNDGETIRINVPILTEERRKDLVKQTKAEGENGKIKVRNARQQVNTELKKLQKDGASEDAVKRAEDSVQGLTDSYIKKIDKMLETKEEEIMTI